MLRLGYSESNLLFCYFLENILKIDNLNYINLQKNLINWLYTTSGFYDKKINGEYMKFDYNECINSIVYNEYFKRLLKIIKEYNGPVQILIYDDWIGDNKKYINDFKLYVNKTNINSNLQLIELYNNIENKKVLIINNLGILMKHQYESGNLKKCYAFCPNITNIEYFNPGYTFFNDGPDESILDTVDKLCQQIDLILNNIDIVIISVGAKSLLLADYIYNIKGKPVLIIGGNLTNFFGINSNRHTKQNILTNEYFIDIPNELKPIGYEKIEGGCYW